MTTEERMKLLRTTLGLNQTEFAKRLGLTSVTISTTESGKTPLIDKNIKLMSLTFGVSEGWLRTGEGEMFTAETEGKENLVGMYRNLSPAVQKAILDLVRAMYDSEQALRPAP
jgi:transcriptional regulator with XRE-family HTH domain